jgi:hypothetical protein
MKKYTKFILGLIIILSSCKVRNSEPNGAYVGYDYYPFEIGRYVEYEVYDTNYTGIIRNDSLYHLKEVIVSSFVEGDETKFVLHQYFKKTTETTYPEQPDSVWSIVNNGNLLIRTENNTSYIKLAFPVAENKSWNRNARNTLGAKTSTMINVDKNYTVKTGYVLPQCLQVDITNEKNFVYLNRKFEVYAREIGPVVKDYTYYSYDQTSLGLYKIDYGFHKVYRVMNYGKQ